MDLELVENLGLRRKTSQAEKDHTQGDESLAEHEFTAVRIGRQQKSRLTVRSRQDLFVPNRRRTTGRPRLPLG